MTKQRQVSVREETVEIPTYEVGKPDLNPMFLEKRVYQGARGASIRCRSSIKFTTRKY